MNVYLDNASTSWPKAPQLAGKFFELLAQCYGNPGRSSHKPALSATRALEDARKHLLAFHNAPKGMVLCWCHNATQALNTAIMGFPMSPQPRIIAGPLEHNATIRPLMKLSRTRNAKIFRLKGDINGKIQPTELKDALAEKTDLIVVNLVSNVSGTIQDLNMLKEQSEKAKVPILIDLAQASGHIEIDLAGVTMAGFTGHKGLLGPTGIGGLIVSPSCDIEPLIYGGGGSESKDPQMPGSLPDRLEAGTQNFWGAILLSEAIKYLESIDKSRFTHCQTLVRELSEQFSTIPGVRVIGPKFSENQSFVLSITVQAWDPQDLTTALDTSFGIAARAGLHCSPWAHEHFGTLSSGGTVRFSPSIFSTDDEITYTIEAIKTILSTDRRN